MMISKFDIRQGWIEFMEAREFKPVALVTLTFDKVEISDRKAWNQFKKWLHEINKYIEGPNYKRKWKHCYFSYFIVGERETRSVVSYHLLIDNWFPWRLAVRYWWNYAGLIDIRTWLSQNQKGFTNPKVSTG